jgi:5'-3' exonuclease
MLFSPFLMPDWLLVDGSSLIFRAFYGVPATVKAPDGRQVNAVRGFLETLTRLIYTRRPGRLAVASDADWRPAWRVDLLPGYKLHRTAEPVPPALIPQLPVIEEMLASAGVDSAGCEGYEAEDVIASWAARIEGSVEIVSGDRDLFALVRDPDRKVLYPEKGGLAEVDEGEVSRRYGIPGRSYADFAVLRGDPSDGLPGLNGVGGKKAADLIRRYGGVAGILAEARLSDPDRDYLERASRVVMPVTDAPVGLPPGRRDSYPAEPERFERLAKANGVENTAERFLGALWVLAKKEP